MKLSIEVTRINEFEVEVDTNHPDFEQWLSGYRHSISRTATIESAIENLVWQVVDGVPGFIEGFGWVKVSGKYDYRAKPDDYRCDFINLVYGPESTDFETTEK